MKNLLLTGVMLAALGYLLYRRSISAAKIKDQPSEPISKLHVDTLDMENIIEWFMSRHVRDFMTRDILAVAINLKTLTTSDSSSEFAAIFSQIPQEHKSYLEAVVLGFFDKEKGTLLPPPHAVMFTADALTPTLTNHFGDKAIIILE